MRSLESNTAALYLLIAMVVCNAMPSADASNQTQSLTAIKSDASAIQRKQAELLKLVDKQRAGKLTASYVAGLTSLGYLYRQSGRPAQAREYLDRAVVEARKADIPESYICQSLFCAASFHYASGNSEKAEKLLREIIDVCNAELSIDPLNVPQELISATTWLAASLCKRGRLNDAVALWAKEHEFLVREMPDVASVASFRAEYVDFLKLNKQDKLAEKIERSLDVQQQEFSKETTRFLSAGLAKAQQRGDAKEVAKLKQILASFDCPAADEALDPSRFDLACLLKNYDSCPPEMPKRKRVSSTTSTPEYDDANLVNGTRLYLRQRVPLLYDDQTVVREFKRRFADPEVLSVKMHDNNPYRIDVEMKNVDGGKLPYEFLGRRVVPVKSYRTD